MKSPAFTFSALLFLLSNICIGQINDCADAEVICSSAQLEFNPQGPGIDDFADPDNLLGCLSGENSTAWYYFEINPAAPPDLVLGFIINPLGGFGEDYDWALYGPDVDCNNLGFPIRCSSSNFACGFCPETGMGMGTSDVTEGPGTGDGFVMTLVVQPGQAFYLFIDNWYGTDNGFTMEWTDSAAPWLNCDAVPPCAVNANPGLPFTVCEGDVFQLHSFGSAETYAWSGTNGSTGFLNDPTIQNPTVTLPLGYLEPILYTLTVIEDTCMDEDAVYIMILPLSVVTLNPLGPFCVSDAPQFLIPNPTGGVWGGAVTSSVFNPALLGSGIHSVTYSYTNADDCTTVVYMDVEVYESPDIEIDPDPAVFCDSEGDIQLTAIASGGAGGFTYNWNTPTGGSDADYYFASVSGPHIVTVTDENGCTNSSVRIVTSHPNPEVEIIDPGPICVTTPFLTITATPAGGFFSGSVISPDGDLQPSMTPPGTYAISYWYTNNNNCEASDNINITIIPVPQAIASNNGPLCNDAQIVLTGGTNGIGDTILYQWSGPNGYVSNAQNPTDAIHAGNYNLQVTIDGCPSPVAVTTVISTPSPDAIALNNGPYCNSDTVQLMGSTNATSGTITYAWSGPNGYVSDDQNPVDATQPGIYSLIVTVEGCPSLPAMTDVVFKSTPDAAATNTGPYCQGESIELLGSTNSPGNAISYLWNGPNGYSSSIQNPSDIVEPGFYQLVINVDGCNSATITTNVTINPLPQPVITGRDSFCIGFSAIIDAGIGYSGYFWNDASMNQTLEVFSEGAYHVTVTDMNGCTAQASFTISESASLSPVITGDLSFCEGSGTTIDAGSGYASYLWSTGEMSQSIAVTNEDNYGVVVTDSDGCSGSVSVFTTINQNPDVTIGGSSTYCIGGHTTLDAGIGYSSYNWSNDSTSQSIIVSSPGVYSINVVDLFGCAGSGSVTVNESTSLSPVITGNDAFCENGSTILNGGSGFATYLWSDGSMDQTLFVDAAGTYAVSVSDGQGCFGDTSVFISEILPPSAILQMDSVLCNTIAGGSVINLFDLVLSGDNNGTWQDVDQSGAVGLFSNLDFNNVAAGKYRFRYTTNSAIDPCPETSYMVTVTVLDCTCPDVGFLMANPLCNAGDVLDLTILENTTETGLWTMIQSPAGSNPAVLNGPLFNSINGDAGDYVFQFGLQNQQPPGCPLDFQIIVHVDQEVDAGVPVLPLEYCFNENVLISLSNLITGEDANGVWRETSVVPSQSGGFDSVNGGFQTISQHVGIYSFEYGLPSNGACPSDASEVSVIIHPVPVVMISDAGNLDCDHTTQTLNASGSSNGSNFDINWTGPGVVTDGNEVTLHPIVEKPGNYLLTITNMQTACTNSASVTVTQNTSAPSDAVVLRQDPACFGDQNGVININEVIGGTPPYFFSLNGGSFSSEHIYDHLSGGNYSIALEDANGCRWDTLIALIQPSETTLDIGPDIQLDLGEHGFVQVLVNLSPNEIDTLIWAPPGIIECFDLLCLEGTIQTFNPLILTATLVDENGCKVSDKLSITVRKNRRVFIPTVFSPNGDGINDIFFISGASSQIVSIRKLVVFNRWGEMLLEEFNLQPNDPSKGWDGTFKNEKINPGVFVYAAEVEFIDGVVEVYKGDVTVIR